MLRPPRDLQPAPASLIAWVLLLGHGSAAAAASDVAPGLYEITVTIELPHVVTNVPPRIARRCLVVEALRSGEAYRPLAENPLAPCPLSGFTIAGPRRVYRIECPGPNSPSAMARFEATSAGYRGVIEMDLGGKNMTMSERQSARRIGDCP